MDKSLIKLFTNILQTEMTSIQGPQSNFEIGGGEHN